MSLVISSKLSALRHAAYIIEVTPPAVIQATGTGVACVVEQFPWGPSQVVTTNSGIGDRLNMFAPPGMSRVGSGYLAMTQKAFPILKVLRVAGTDATPAAAIVGNAAPAAPTAGLVASAGLITNGTHQWAYTYVDGSGENVISTASNVLTTVTADHGQATLTGITVGPVGTTARNVYRTKAGVPGVFYLLTTLADNTTTTFTDNIADGTLGAVPATATGLFTITAKYPGIAGNSLTWQTLAATDGDANHFNLTVTVTGASGTTQDIFQNLNYSGVGADSIPTFNSTFLVGAITKSADGVPLTTTGVFTGGSEGTITSATYVGTQGTGDKGLAATEGDTTIRHIFFGDPGNSFRTACNAGMKSHVDFKGDRCGYINGPSGQSNSAVLADNLNNASENLFYSDPWVYIFDDVDGTKRLVPGAPFEASMAANLSPSTSVAWKSPEATKFLGAIVGLEVDRGDATSINTAAGICTFIKEVNGGFSIEAGVTTIAAADVSRKNDTRTRMLQFIGTSLLNSVRVFIDSPNTPDNQQNIIDACDAFLDTLKRNAGRDANHLPHILDYQIEDLATANPQANLDAGEFSVPFSIKLSSGMSKIFFLMNIGQTVSIRVLS